MAKVKIQGNASGTGVLTVTAPNTSTDRTITLPDSTGTLATTADTGVAGITSAADATAITIDSSERVGIGTGSPLTNSLLHIQSNASSGVSAINNGLLLVENNTGVGIGLLSNNDRQQTIAFGDPEDNDVGFINYGHDTNQMSFNVNAAERMRITANGVTFNGDTAAANALDDYEEGTFTTTANVGSGTITLVSSQDLGAYVKIGSLVHWSLHIGVSSTSSASGDLYFTLPFTLGNFGELAGEGSFSCWVWSATTGDSGTWVGWVERGLNRAYLRRGAGTQPGTSGNEMTGGTEIRMSGTFRTA